MKNLLIQTAKRTGIADADALEKYFEENKDDPRRPDELLMSSPEFTEDVILKLFAEALAIPYLPEISTSDVP